MRAYLQGLAKQSFSALMDTTEWMIALRPDVEAEAFRRMAAASVFGLCESVLWADRKLQATECDLLDALLEVDADRGGALAQAIASRPVHTNWEAERQLLECAIRTDRMHGTRLAPIMLNALESLAHLLATADGKVQAQEAGILESYMDRWRGLVSARAV